MSAACKCGHAHADHAPARTECMDGDCECRGYAPAGVELRRRVAGWTPRKYNAAIVAIGAMQASHLAKLAAGEKNTTGVRFADLEAARDLLADERDRAAAARSARIDAKLRAELGKAGAR